MGFDRRPCRACWPSVLSCGFAFPVINVAWEFFGGASIAWLDGEPISTMRLAAAGDLVAQRTRLYSWAWQFAVAGGTGFAILVALATIH